MAGVFNYKRISIELIMYSQENTSLKIVVRLTDRAVFSRTGKHLSNIETQVLQGAWKGQKYPQIASETGYAIEYLKNCIGPQLWRRLSETFGEKIKKANVKIVLQHQLEEEEKTPAKTGEEKTQEKNNRESGEKSLDPIQLILQEDQSFSAPPDEKIGLYTTHNSMSIFNVEEQYLPLTTLSSPVCHNLPCSETKLIGRDFELQQLLQWLSSEQSMPRIGIEGIGGIGKTHLLLEVAHRCLKSSQVAFTQKTSNRNCLPLFEAIIFTSAQSHYCTIHGLLPRLSQERTLDDIIRTILHTLHINGFSDSCPDKAYAQAQKSLVGVRSLLIIDSLDKVKERQKVLGFLYGLPSTVKVIVTSREKSLFPSIYLTALSQDEAFGLIQHLAREQGLSLTLEELEKIHKITENVPAAIVRATSLLVSGYSLQDVSSLLARHTESFAQFYCS